MNKNRILGIFILIALLITCIGVSYASDISDDSSISELSIDLSDDYVIVDDFNLDDDSNDADYDSDYDDDYDSDDADYDSDYDDDDLDDEDWDDYDDDESLDDEDWEDYDDDDFWDDEYWYDYDDDDDDWYIAYGYLPDDEYYYDTDMYGDEDGNFTSNAKMYYKVLACNKCTDAGWDSNTQASDYNDSEDNSEDSYYENETASSLYEVYLGDSIGIPLTLNANDNSVAEHIDLPDVGENVASYDSNTSEEKDVANVTVVADSQSDDLGIFALLALLLVSLVILV